MKKRVLITGANGQQGGAVVKQLLNNEYTVRVFVRSDESVERFTAHGIEVAIGTYDNSNSLRKALQDVNYVFLTYPVQFEMQTALAYCEAFIQAANDSLVERIVYNTSAWYPDNTEGTLLQEIRKHMELAFQASGLPFVILRPTLYLNNFFGGWSLPNLLQQGVLAYPVEANQTLAWTTHELSAAYALKAFEQPHIVGNRYDIANYLLTGNEIAEKFTAFLQRNIRYEFIDPLVFEKKLAQQAGTKIAREVADSYRYIYNHPENYQTDTTKTILGNGPLKRPSLEAWLLTQSEILQYPFPVINY
ncbi:MAG TPA: NmrA family NAD(P)-binding protein [Flavisolibacter sp.]|nr:NmrA family NAD(P)-binding protein [Flavisolibacter sp.]